MADDRIKGYDQQKIGLDGVALRAGAGAVGGIVAKTATAPLERVKMLLQVQAMNSLLTNASAQPKYKGIVGTFRKLYAEEGFLAMFHGNGANCYRIAPAYALRFSMNDKFKEVVMRDGQSFDALDTWQLAVAGTMAGLLQISVMYPLETIRSRLCVSTSLGDTHGKYSGVLDCARKTVRTEGVRGLYKGFVPCMVAGAPYVGAQMTFYERFKRLIEHLDSDKRIADPIRKLMAGGASGVASQTVVFPADTIRRRMQMNGQGGGQAVYDGTTDCIRQTMQKEGIAGFYKGCGANLVRAVPGVAIQFAVYDMLKDAMESDRVEEGAAVVAQRTHDPADIRWEQLNKGKFVCSSLAAILAVRMVIFPPSLIKTRMQVRPDVYPSTKQAFRSVLRKEGLAGLYKGFGPTITGVVPAQLTYVGVYEGVRSHCPDELSRFANLLGGGLASVASISIGLPLDVISQRMMLQGAGLDSKFSYSNGMDGFRHILATEGIRGLYRGYVASLMTSAPQSAVWWATYQPVKRQLVQWYWEWGNEDAGSSTVDGNTRTNTTTTSHANTSPHTSPYTRPHTNASPHTNTHTNTRTSTNTNASPNAPPRHYPTILHGLSGTIAAVAAACISTPLDVLKTRLQTHNLANGPVPSLATLARQTYAQGGVRAFYKGFAPRLLSMGPASFLLITAYEWCKSASVKM